MPPPKARELQKGDVIYLDGSYKYNPVYFNELSGNNLIVNLANYITARLALRNYLKDVVKVVRDGKTIWER